MELSGYIEAKAESCIAHMQLIALATMECASTSNLHIGIKYERSMNVTSGRHMQASLLFRKLLSDTYNMVVGFVEN
jgi:hypothetical protein